VIVQIEPWIDQCELDELKRVINSTFLVEHDLTREFESATADLTNSRHAVAICNGTMALFVCLRALGIGFGDEVIVPNLTFVATANAVILAGATPVLCEVREDTFCIDVVEAEKLITSRTRALLPVHLYGQSSDMIEVMRLAGQYNLKVIEDAAQGVGVRFRGRHVGTFGDFGMLSYYGNKTITCGEGGMVLTDSDDLARAVYRLKNHGREKKGVFVHETIGFNFSFTELQAAVGISQMKKLPAIIQQKKEIHDRYAAQLGDLEDFQIAYVDPRCEPVFWFTSFLSESVDALSAWLYDKNIQTRRFFYPLHRQPCYVDGKNVRTGGSDFKVSESIYRRGISLPSSYFLTEDEQGHVIEEIRRFYADRH
jgi:perosamine synthetase